MEVASEGDVTVHCPIAFGSVAYWLGKKADESATHRWTLFVRGPNGEDISYCVSKVVFYLHESFAQAVRTVSEPPFEVTENGWGEFDTRIRIYFRDSSEESLEILHPLKLYPPNGAPPSAKKPVVSEFYDEVCFTNPSEEFYGMMARDAQKACVESSLQEHFTVFSEARDLQSLIAAQALVSAELDKAKDDMWRVEKEKAALREKLGISWGQAR